MRTASMDSDPPAADSQSQTEPAQQTSRRVTVTTSS
jgi:hypothetical protein